MPSVLLPSRVVMGGWQFLFQAMPSATTHHMTLSRRLTSLVLVFLVCEMRRSTRKTSIYAQGKPNAWTLKSFNGKLESWVENNNAL